MCAFAAAIRRNIFGKSNKTLLQGETVKNTIQHIRQIFQTNGYLDPGSDKSGATNLKLTRIFNGYKKFDPNTRNQFALPLDVIKLLYFNRLTPKNRHIGLLATGALFFGMRSCEYLQVRNQQHKQTKLLIIQNFQFYKNNQRQNITDPNIREADFIAITFVSQKNGNKNQTIIQHRSNRTLCPVKAWGTLITLILSYEKTSTLTPINYFVHDNGPSQITATDMITQIRAACKTLGEQKIGIEIDRVGTHSIRMSFAMQLHLAGVKDHIIMMQGRWKSLSFLRYIRLQIQELSEDLSRKMASTATAHFNISNTRRNIVKTEILH